MRDRAAREAILKIATDLGYYKPEDWGSKIYLNDLSIKATKAHIDACRNHMYSLEAHIRRILDYLDVEVQDKLVKRTKPK